MNSVSAVDALLDDLLSSEDEEEVRASLLEFHDRCTLCNKCPHSVGKGRTNWQGQWHARRVQVYVQG
jgi:hypothetical protein